MMNLIKEKMTKREFRLLIILICSLFLFFYFKLLKSRFNKKIQIEHKIEKSMEKLKERDRSFLKLEALKNEDLDLNYRISLLSDEYSKISNYNDLILYLESILKKEINLISISTNNVSRKFGEQNIDFININLEILVEWSDLYKLIESVDLIENKIFLRSLDIGLDNSLKDRNILIRLDLDLLENEQERILVRENIKESVLNDKKFNPFESNIYKEEDMEEDIIDELIQYETIEKVNSSIEEASDYTYREQEQFMSEKQKKTDLIIEKYEMEFGEILASHSSVEFYNSSYSFKNKKFNKLDYVFLSKENENTIYCPLKEAIAIRDGLNSISLNIFSYSNLLVDIKLVYKDMKGEIKTQKFDLEAKKTEENIFWIKERLDNPIEIIGIEIVSQYGVDSRNVILIEEIQLLYNESSNQYILHKIIPGESLNDILLNYYGDLSMKKKVKEINHIYDDNLERLNTLILERK